MRPEDVRVSSGGERSSVPVPFDLELEALDAELGAAGARARRTLNGQTQPTRYFAMQLRDRLLAVVEDTDL